MPTVARFGKILIRIFADDHHPPHFHVVTPDHEVTVLISDFSILAGRIDRRSLDIALEWARENRNTLHNEWNRLNEE